MLLKFAFLLSIFFLLSCSDTYVYTSDNGTQKASGDLFVRAVDAVSGVSIPNAVFFLAAKDSFFRKSNGEGGTIYRNLPIGDNYAVSARALGYAGSVCNAAIKIADNQSASTNPSVENTTLEVPLRKRVSSLRGSIFYQNVKNPHQIELFVAAGAKVSLHVLDNECSYERRVFGPVTVDKDGFFSFDSLPEKAAYTLMAHDAMLGDFLYSGIEITGALGTSGNSTIVPRIIYNMAQSTFGFMINSDNRSSTEKGDALTFGFSEPVNVSLLRSGDLAVSKTDAAKTPVATNFTWSDQNRSLSIKPAFGEWESSQRYEITLKLYSALSSKIMDTVLVFSVNEFFDISKLTVSGIKTDAPVSYNTGSVTLRWNSMANAEAYEIYAKVSSRFESIYSFVREIATVTRGKVDTSYALSTSNWFQNGDSALILIAARNGKGKSSFGKPFVIKDNTLPRFSGGPYAIAPDTANYRIDATTYFNSTVNESVVPINIGFNEPMNTSAVLSVDIPSQTPRLLNAELKWTNTTTLNISFKIGAGNLNSSKEPLKIPIIVSGLKDIAGNPVATTTVGTKTWNGLLILMHVNGVP